MQEILTIEQLYQYRFKFSVDPWIYELTIQWAEIFKLGTYLIYQKKPDWLFFSDGVNLHMEVFRSKFRPLQCSFDL